MITIIILSGLLIISILFTIHYYLKILKIRKILIEHKLDFIDMDKILCVQESQLKIIDKLISSKNIDLKKIVNMIEHNVNYNKVLLYTFKKRIKEKQ